MRELRPETKLFGDAQHVVASALEINHPRSVKYRRAPQKTKFLSVATGKKYGVAGSTAAYEYNTAAHTGQLHPGPAVGKTAACESWPATGNKERLAALLEG